MKQLIILLAIALTGCNNVMREGEETQSEGTTIQDTTNNVDKLNNIINENQEAGDSMKGVEKMEPELKNPQ
ncbi:MAG: hypothetical protein V4565_03160 [Bacteroidota bacterium]